MSTAGPGGPVSTAGPPACAIRWGSWPCYAALAAGALAAVLLGGAVHRWRYLPLLLSLVVLGMPHGAVDHLVPAWARGRPLGGRERLRLLAAYVGVSVAGVGLWLAAPRAALELFLAVAVVHWGTAELWWFPDVRRPLAFAAARGLVPIVVPAVAHPGAVAAAMEELLRPFVAVPPDLAPGGPIRMAAAVALSVVGVAGAGRRPREVLELAGLAAFFAIVDPVFAVGLYFMAWHSWRHVLRLATVCPRAARNLASGHPARAVGRVLRAAFPCTMLALGGLGLLAGALDVRVVAAPR